MSEELQLTDVGYCCVVLAVVIDKGQALTRLVGVYDTEETARQRMEESFFYDDCQLIYLNEVVWGVKG